MIDEDDVSAFAEVAGWIAAARQLVVLTGAGISTDSGIPDFRGPNGLWTKDPGAERRANLSVWMADPEVRRDAWRRRVDSPPYQGDPNPGHLAIGELDRIGLLHLLVTQNVDGLHQRGGVDAVRVVEVHGNVRESMCLGCGRRTPIEEILDRVRAGDEDPACEVCGGILKSATVSFGQALFPGDIERAERAALGADVLLAVGTTLAVYPVAGIVPVAQRAGARVVIVNAEPTAMDDLADVVVRGSISEVLPVLVPVPESRPSH